MASTCGFCGTAFWPYLQKCKGSRQGNPCPTLYCNIDCQKRDWKNGHKNVCAIKQFSWWYPRSSKSFEVTKLPTEIWMKIFNHLATKDIVRGKTFGELKTILYFCTAFLLS